MIRHAKSVALGVSNHLDVVGGKLTFSWLRRQTAALDGPTRMAVFYALPGHRQDEAWVEQSKRAELDQLEEADEVDTDRYRELVSTLDRDKPPRPKHKPQQWLADVRHDDLLDIPSATYIEALSGEYVGRGDVMCPLPDHEGERNRPSLRVYEATNTWYCWGCHRGGTIFDLAAGLWGIEPRGKGFLEIKRRLAERFGMRPA